VQNKMLSACSAPHSTHRQLIHHRHKSLGVSPVCRAIRASMLGPISSPS
jgi:hypothetical protein